MERIRELRAERGLTQIGLAVAADMNPATLNRIEMGKANPNLKTLERLAEALGVEVADFFPKAQAPLPEIEEQRRDTGFESPSRTFHMPGPPPEKDTQPPRVNLSGAELEMARAAFAETIERAGAEPTEEELQEAQALFLEDHRLRLEEMRRRGLIGPRVYASLLGGLDAAIETTATNEAAEELERRVNG